MGDGDVSAAQRIPLRKRLAASQSISLHFGQRGSEVVSNGIYDSSVPSAFDVGSGKGAPPALQREKCTSRVV